MDILDEETEDFIESDSNGHKEAPDYSDLFKAPDFSDFVKKTETAVAKEYKTKTRSFLKYVLMGAVQNNDLPDAAAIIKHGNAFANATGTLADENEMVRKAIDIIASPANPYMAFAIAAMPLISQIFRNHEQEIKTIPDNIRSKRERRKLAKEQGIKRGKPTLNLKIFGRTIKIGLGLRFPVGRFMLAVTSQSQEPQAVVYEVFSDVKVIRALEKQGIRFDTK